MKTTLQNKTHLARKLKAGALAASLLVACVMLPAQDSAEAAGDDSKRPAVLIIAAAGGYSVDGNKGKFQRDFGLPADGYAGIEKLTIGKEIDDTSRIDIVGRAFVRQGDYMIGVKYTKDEMFRIEAGYKQTRTWYDGDAGYYGPTDTFYTLPDNILYTDRGELWFEAATLFTDNKPNFTLRYERATRRGTKDSTHWGDAATVGSSTQKLGFAYYDLDDTVDTITLDVEQQLEKVTWGAGARYQHMKVAGDTYTSLPSSDGLSDDSPDTSTDLFSAHAYVDGILHPKLSYAAGGLITTLDTDISGNRLIYSGSDPLYDPGERTVKSADYSGLGGGNNYKQYVANANLTWMPTKKWVIVPALRMEDYRTDSMSEYMATARGASSPTLYHADSNNKWFEVTESIEARYTGFKNWTHNIAVEFLQGTGDLDETLYSNYAVPDPAPSIYRGTDQDRFTQKYSYSVNWYAKPGLSFAGQYYYKYNKNTNDTPPDRDSSESDGDRYPAYISYQSFGTHDFNIRATWRAMPQLSFVTRYDFQLSTIDTACASGDYGLPRAESAKSTTHIISETISATPHPRLWLLATASLVFDQIKSPIVSWGGGALQNSDNNYFNGGLGAMFVATDLDDLGLDYTFYKTDNYSDNSAYGVPYGGSERKHIVALSWTRRVTAHMNITFRYTYANYKDKAYGGHRDYTANGLYGRLQYQF